MKHFLTIILCALAMAVAATGQMMAGQTEVLGTNSMVRAELTDSTDYIVIHLFGEINYTEGVAKDTIYFFKPRIKYYHEFADAHPYQSIYINCLVSNAFGDTLRVYADTISSSDLDLYDDNTIESAISLVGCKFDGQLLFSATLSTTPDGTPFYTSDTLRMNKYGQERLGMDMDSVIADTTRLSLLVGYTSGYPRQDVSPLPSDSRLLLLLHDANHQEVYRDTIGLLIQDRGPQGAAIGEQLVELSTTLQGGKYTVSLSPLFHTEDVQAISTPLFVYSSQVTKVEDVDSLLSARKQIINGQLIISRDGRQYTILGIRQ